jgi:hypothetical protein
VFRLAPRAAITATLAVVVIGVWLMPDGVRSTATAAGSGPTITLGAASGADVPVAAATTSADPYNGFHLHVAAATSAGVALTEISGSATGSTLDAGGLFCTTQVPAVHEVNYGCVALAGQSTTTAGLLATMTLHATGNGCITVRLVDLPPGDPNAVVSDTYTVDQLTTTVQQNTVGAGTVRVTVGTGTLPDCIGGASVGGASVGGIAQDPHLPARMIPSGGRPDASAAIVVGAVIAMGLSTWYVRRWRRQ